MEEDNQDQTLSVITARGSGSGYVMQRDGVKYVVTATHVVLDQGNEERPPSLNSFPLQRSEGDEVAHYYVIGDGRYGYALAQLEGFSTHGITCEDKASSVNIADWDVATLRLLSTEESQATASALLNNNHFAAFRFDDVLVNNGGTREGETLLPNPLQYDVISNISSADDLTSMRLFQTGRPPGQPVPFDLETVSGVARHAAEGLKVTYSSGEKIPRGGFSGGPAFDPDGAFVGQTIAVFSDGEAEIVPASYIERALDYAAAHGDSPQPDTLELCDSDREGFVSPPNTGFGGQLKTQHASLRD